MRETKKGDNADTLSPVKNESLTKNSKNKLTHRQTHAIEFYPNGFELQAPAKGGNPNIDKMDKKRGKIKGWSAASRRRFREFLLKHSIPNDLTLYALTLTIPGPVISDVLLAKSMFENFCRRIKRRELPMIWRVEIQKRGQLHWHCMLGANLTIHEIKTMWLHSLDSVGRIGYLTTKWVKECKHLPLEGDFEETEKGLMIVCYLSKCVGAYDVGPKVDLIEDKTQGWIRYLHDHTTKRKQEQIPENIGKHWDIITRKKFIEQPPQLISGLTLKEYSRVMRWFSRLCTPYIRDSSALFGRRRGFYWRRGKSGKSVFFSDPATLQRMVNLATSY